MFEDGVEVGLLYLVEAMVEDGVEVDPLYLVEAMVEDGVEVGLPHRFHGLLNHMVPVLVGDALDQPRLQTLQENQHKLRPFAQLFL